MSLLSRMFDGSATDADRSKFSSVALMGGLGLLGASQPGAYNGMSSLLAGGASGAMQGLQMSQAQEVAAQESAQKQKQKQAVQQYVSSLPPQQQALASAFPELMAKQAAEAAFAKQGVPDLVKTIDPATGREVWTPKTQAAGMVAGMPGAQNFPSSKRALDSQTGKMTFVTDKMIAENPQRYTPVPSGMSVETGPDGRFRLVTGDMASQGGGGTPLTGSNQSKQQEAFIASMDQLSAIDSMLASYDPSFSTFWGQLENQGLRWADRANISLDQGQQKQLAQYTSWQRATLDNLSSTLNRLSGAAVSPSEYDRIASTLPNTDDSPTQFIQKIKDVRKKTMLAAMRAYHFQKNGITPDTVNFSRLSLPQMQKMVNERGDTIAEAFKEQNPDASIQQVRDAVRAQLQSEFGMTF